MAVKKPAKKPATKKPVKKPAAKKPGKKAAQKVTGPAAYFPSIEKKYGRPIAHWAALIRERAHETFMQVVAWLKSEHRLGHGHATALVAHTLGTAAKKTKKK